MGIYLFADCPFAINFGKGEERYKDFCTAESHNPIQMINIGEFKEISTPSYGVEYLSRGFDNFFRSQENPTSMLFADKSWSNAYVCRGQNGEYSEELVISAVYSRLCSENVMLLHASYVDVNGYGIVFIGPSGIGKTTQAQLWEKYRGAKIVNGDKVFVRKIDDGVYAYGTPWKGSSPYDLNEKSPLKGIVILQQSKENNIRRLSPTDAAQLFLPHVFMPNWDEQCMCQLLETFEKTIKKVPLYLLECKPDEESVVITEKIIFE